MEGDSTRGEASSGSGSTNTIPQQQPDNTEFFAVSRSSAPSSPSATGTLSRLGLKSPTSPSAAGGASSGQVSAITVVALLDKLVNMLESVQDNQRRMETRQGDLEQSVRVLQGDVTRLTKNHLGTSVSVSKLLERSRKVNGHVKEVKERLDRQAVQVKKLEANHNHLLKRNNFKVLIFQEDNEIPAHVVVKDSLRTLQPTPLPSQYDAESTHPTPSVTGSVEAIRTQDEALQTISLSSEDDLDFSQAHRLDEESLECEAIAIAPIKFERRADQFKRNSLKKVDTLKKAFTRQNIEKKMTQISSKIVPPEKREKIKKSFTPNHPKSPTARSSSFKVSPMTFNVKKVRDGETPTPQISQSGEEIHVDIPTLTGLDAEIPSVEVRAPTGLDAEIPSVEVRAPTGLDREIPSAKLRAPESVIKVIQETLNSSNLESVKAEVSLNGKTSNVECEINGDGVAGLAVPELDGDIGEEEEEEKKGEEKQESPVEKTAEAQIPTETIAVEQVS